MLILDGYGNYLIAEFDCICTENNIISICIPPHSLHLLQPLDVNCFTILKRQYERLVENWMRNSFNHINKTDFLTAFPEARTAAYKSETIRNGFTATGLVPFNSEQVIQHLITQVKTPTPPHS
jgi:hypothetical protein